MREYDAVIIGAGINGLVAAAELGRAGWSVAVIERNSEVGGFLASAEVTSPGYVHDVYASWFPQFVGGVAYEGLGSELKGQGVEFCNTDNWVTASVDSDGRVVRAHRDIEITASELDAADRRAYVEMFARVERTSGSIGRLMSSDLASGRLSREAFRLLRALGPRGAERFLRDTVSSADAALKREFLGCDVDHLWAPWLLHAGLSPTAAGGGLMLPLVAKSIHAFGLPVVKGGSGRFVSAMLNIAQLNGVHVLTNTEATQIRPSNGRIHEVRTSRHSVRSRRAVIASMPPPHLDRLLAGERAAKTRSWRQGRGAMQIHVALLSPPPWSDRRLTEIPLIHLSDGMASAALACAEAEAGLLPRRATVVVGQQFILDPSRVPAGGASLWIQLQEVPASPIGDAAGVIEVRGRWSEEVTHSYVDRILGRIEEVAPGVTGLVKSISTYTPDDLEAYNSNAVGGNPYGGASELDQNFRWRSWPGLRPSSTGVNGVYQIGGSVHPGPGLSGASGHRVATRLLRSGPFRASASR